MIRTRSLILAGLAAAVALSFLPLQANAQVPSYSPPAFQRPSFSAAAVSLQLPQIGAGDAVCIFGSASKTVRVKRIAISGTDTTAQTVAAALVLRSAANSGGTSTTPTVAPLDPSNAAGTAVVRAYTAVPTPGATIATVRAQSIPLPAAASATQYPPVVWTFGENSTQDIVLKGTAQGACVNFPAAFTTAGAIVNVDVTWTEQ
jgi:hypothetical protein